MTIPPIDGARSFMNDRLQLVLHVLANVKDGEQDQVDRALAAVMLLAGAAVIVWPEGRKVPVVVTQVASLARGAWARRSWWLPAARP